MIEGLVKVVVILVVTLIHMVITGICLAIGFKIGHIIYEMGEKEIQKRKNVTPATAV